VGFVMDKMALGLVFLEAPWFSPISYHSTTPTKIKINK
jgi:hypothetical protein